MFLTMSKVTKDELLFEPFAFKSSPIKGLKNTDEYKPGSKKCVSNIVTKIFCNSCEEFSTPYTLLIHGMYLI